MFVEGNAGGILARRRGQKRRVHIEVIDSTEVMLIVDTISAAELKVALTPEKALELATMIAEAAELVLSRRGK